VAVYSDVTGTTKKSLYIHSTEPVSVYALNQATNTTDATFVLPVDVLGTDYYHISYKGDIPDGLVPAGFADGYTIVATEDDTEVYKNDGSTIGLSKGQVYSEYIPQADLTGYHITSTKPVAYFVTNQLVTVPSGTQARDHLYEQMTPVNVWGKEFVVPVTKRGVERVRIVASQDNTTITQSGGVIQAVAGGQTSLNLNHGQFVELEILLADSGCYILSDKPVGVASYLVGQNHPALIYGSGTIGDPSLTVVPPIEQMIYNADIAPFPTGASPSEHYVMVITPTVSREQTTVTTGSGAPAPLSGGNWKGGNAGGSGKGADYSFYTMPLDPSKSYHFFNPDGLLVMGFGLANMESYCYLSGAAMRTLDAGFLVNDVPNLALDHSAACTDGPLKFRASGIRPDAGTPGYLKWYIDGMEEMAARDAMEWSKALPSGEHEVSLTVDACNVSTFSVTFTVINASTMRWTGLKNTSWHNAENWVEVRTAENGQTYETPVPWHPLECTNVVIPPDMPHYPELNADTAAWCHTITVQDRAMIANPHALNYDSAQVELKLKATERDRFVMWSAPLHNMYSGDYHFKTGNPPAPNWGDVSMNYFQLANPHGGASQPNLFTSTFGEPGDPLLPGKAFNLKLTSTSLSREATWVFPQPDKVYYPAGGRPAVPVQQRDSAHRFITDGLTPDLAGRFRMPVRNDVEGGQLVQVVNPYLAYLCADSFLVKSTHNNSLLGAGYLIWDGRAENSFIAVRVVENYEGMKDSIRVISSLPQPLSADARLIPPLQSFFVMKENVSGRVDSVDMSPRWTTTVPPGEQIGYMLRAAEEPQEEGVLRICATQGNGASYAALYYDRNASPEYRGSEDVRCLFFDDNLLTIYTLTSLNEPLSIYADGSFDRHETPLGLRLTQPGEVTLEFTGLETFGHDVYLIDRERDNLEVSLRETPAYTFTATQARPALNDRFVLRTEYTGRGLTEASALDGPGIRCHGHDGYIHVRAVRGTMRRLEVFNVPGALVYATGKGATEYSIPATTGIYIVKVETDDGAVQTEKVIVR
jgi:hypothetical protein